MSPTVLRIGPHRLYFVSHDMHEPPHIHIDRDDCSAKFWLNPIALAFNLGYPPKELRKLESIVIKHQVELMEAWDEYFGT